MQLPEYLRAFCWRSSGKLSFYSIDIKISVFMVRAGNADPILFMAEYLLGGSR